MNYRDNIDPKIWGPPGWEFLDAIVGGYPYQATNDEKRQMTAFLISLGNVLPCSTCRKNYTDFATAYPPSLHVSGRMEVAKWLNMYKKHKSKTATNNEETIDSILQQLI